MIEKFPQQYGRCCCGLWDKFSRWTFEKMSCDTSNTGEVSLLCVTSCVSPVRNYCGTICHIMSKDMAFLLCGISVVVSAVQLWQNLFHRIHTDKDAPLCDCGNALARSLSYRRTYHMCCTGTASLSNASCGAQCADTTVWISCHIMHKHMGAPVGMRTWDFKTEFVRNLLSQYKQANGLSPVWCRRWTVSKPWELNLFSQRLQAKDRILGVEWIRKCWFRSFRLLYVLSHWVHLNGCFKVWTKRWLFKAESDEKVLPRSRQVFLFSLIVLSMKGRETSVVPPAEDWIILSSDGSLLLVRSRCCFTPSTELSEHLGGSKAASAAVSADREEKI